MSKLNECVKYITSFGVKINAIESGKRSDYEVKQTVSISEDIYNLSSSDIAKITDFCAERGVSVFFPNKLNLETSMKHYYE